MTIKGCNGSLWPGVTGSWLLTCHIANIILIFELLAKKSGLAGCDIEDRREGGRGSSSSSVPSEA
jgi:hypothetical protein